MAWVSVAFAVFVAAARGGTIRHDVSDQLYRDLALDYSMVGSITSNVFGSGTLIGMQWVLTAAHVVEARVNNPGGVRFNVGGQQYTGTVVLVHDSWNTDSIAQGYDFALIRLDRPVTHIDPAGLSQQADVRGQVGTFVGFGRTGTGLTGATQTHGTKRAGQNMIDTYSIGSGQRILMSDFDQPDAPSKSSYGSSIPLPLEYCPAGGDSGGGAFIDNNGTPELVGVISFLTQLKGSETNALYGNGFGYGRVYPFLSWIANHRSTHGLETVWSGGTGNWLSGGNWSHGAPSAATGVLIEGGTAQVSSGGAADFMIVGRSGAGAVQHTGGTLTVGRSVTLGGASGGMGDYTLSGGRLIADSVTVGGQGAGALRLTGSSARIDTNSLAFGASATLEAVGGASVYLGAGAAVTIAGTDPIAMAGLENLRLVFEGGTSATGTLEVAGSDMGLTMDGYIDNFSLGTLQVGGDTAGKVKLVNQTNNRPGAEALYLDTLVLGAGSTLDLAGQTLYVRTMIDGGGTLLENGGQWWHMVELGDFNGDGVLSGLDIPDFKAALADPDGWEAANRRSVVMAGDFNGDGAFSGLDIPGFKQALAGNDGSGAVMALFAPAIPEPATALLVLSALGVLKGAMRRRGRAA